MRVKIGIYDIGLPKEARKSKEKAVKYIQSIYPELIEKVIEKHLKDFPNEQKSDKPDNTAEPTENSEEKRSYVRETGSRRKPSGEN